MDYRGIITQGYHIDAGGQTAIRIISQGYVGALAELIAANIIRMVNVALSHPVIVQTALFVSGAETVIMSVPAIDNIEMEV